MTGIRFSRRAANRLIAAHVDEYLRYLKEADDVARAKQNERGRDRYRRVGRPDRVRTAPLIETSEGERP